MRAKSFARFLFVNDPNNPAKLGRYERFPQKRWILVHDSFSASVEAA